MIKYNLECKCGHTFESWFSSSTEFELLSKKKLINCIKCDSIVVKKTLMTPNLPGKSNKIKKNGIMFISTINRNLKSYLFAIIGAEYVLRWLPIGTHDWEKFIKPDNLISIAKNYKLKLIDLSGLKFNPLLDKWNLTNDKSVNYIANFIKN